MWVSREREREMEEGGQEKVHYTDIITMCNISSYYE